RANPVERVKIEIVRDDESRVPEDNEVQSVKIVRMVQNGRVELHDQMAAGANRDDLIGAVGRVEGIGRFAEWVDLRGCAQRRRWVGEARREADSRIVTYDRIGKGGGVRGEDKAGRSQRQQTSF